MGVQVARCVDSARAAASLLVLGGIPLTAAAQRVEIAFFVGGYQPLPSVQRSADQIECDEPCPPFVQRTVSWGWGALIGGRLSLQLDSRFGFDATIHRVHVTNQRSFQWGAESSSSHDDVAATFVVVQPHVRLRVNDSVHAAIGVGPFVAFTRTTYPQGPGAPDARLGVALSAALRMHVRGPFDLELRASDYLYLEANGPRPRNVHDFTVGAGLAFAFNRRRA